VKFILPIIAGALLFALGILAGTILFPNQSSPVSSAAKTAAVDSSTAAAAHRESLRSEAESLAGASAISSDFGSRLQQALHGATDRIRRRAMLTLADGLTPAQIQAALEQINKLTAKDKPALMAALLGQWALTDPKSATQYALTLPRKSDRAQAINAVAAGWAENDPKAAEDWVGTLKDHSARMAAPSLPPIRSTR